jgi:hypothetical protein
MEPKSEEQGQYDPTDGVVGRVIVRGPGGETTEFTPDEAVRVSSPRNADDEKPSSD